MQVFYFILFYFTCTAGLTPIVNVEPTVPIKVVVASYLSVSTEVTCPSLLA